MAAGSKIDAYVEELVRYSWHAGRFAYGKHPIDMTPMAYVSGALHALERIGAISQDQLLAGVDRCHAAYGLKRPGRLAPDPNVNRVVAYEPEWADTRPERLSDLP
jgi:hypothetical protein